MSTIEQITNDILRICEPNKIILFNEKRTMSTGKLKALSFCVIISSKDCRKLRTRLHLALSADIPVNFVVYTVFEWTDLLSDSGSYASWIAKKGRVVYEQKA